MMRALAPHVRRAVDVSGRLAGAGAWDSAIDRLKVAVFGLDHRGRVLVLNRAAEAILAQSDGLGADASGLCAARSDDTAALRRRIADAASPLDDGAAPVVLQRPSGKRALVAHVVPIARRPLPLDFSGTRVLVFVVDPDAGFRAGAVDLQRLLGLTPAEARCAMSLAEGLSPKEIADRLGVSYETVRSQLRSIYDKTGVRRQAALVRLIQSVTAGSAGSPIQR
jgi:DNA-binding CsgD family transcriptional regulator